MNIYQCEEKAKDVGFDSAKFFVAFPAGLVECQWLDAYIGLLKIDAEGLRDGFLTTKQIDEMFPDLKCTEPFIDVE